MLKYIMAAAALLVLTGCGGVDPDSPLGKRKALFKQMLNTSEDMGGMLRGRLVFDEQQFKDKAVLLDEISRQPWQYFDNSDNSGKSGARDAVWQQQEKFSQLARELEASTERLLQTLEQAPLNKDAVALRVDLIEKACENCHQEFRVF